MANNGLQRSGDNASFQWSVSMAPLAESGRYLPKERMVLEAHLFRDIKPDFTQEEAANYVTSFDRNECGCLWLYHPSGTQLAILINGNQTYSLFIPDGDHPGWQVAASDDGDWDTEVHFLADNKEPTPMQLALVIPIDRCLDILKLFWETGGRSNTEVWSSLVDGEP